MKKKKKKKCQLGSPLRPITRTTPDSNDLTFDLCRDPYRWTPFQLQFHLGNHFEFDFLIFFLLSFFVLFLFSFRLHFTTHRPSIAGPSPAHRRPIAGAIHARSAGGRRPVRALLRRQSDDANSNQMKRLMCRVVVCHAIRAVICK